MIRRLLPVVCVACVAGCSTPQNFVPTFAPQPSRSAVNSWNLVSAASTSRVRPPAVQSVPVNRIAWQTLGNSSEGRPFQLARIGQGDFRVLLFGSARGHDPVAKALLNRTIDYLHENQMILGGFSCLAIQSPHPDHAALRQDQLDPGRVRREADVLGRLILRYRPHRIVHLVRSDTERGAVHFNPLAAHYARRVSRSGALSANGQSFQRGSFEWFLQSVIATQIVAIRVDDQSTVESVWPRYRDAVLSAFRPDVRPTVAH